MPQYFSCIVVVSFIRGVHGENHRPAASQSLSHMLYWVHLARVGFELTNLVAIGTDCICSCKSNYHTITTAPSSWEGRPDKFHY